MQIASDGLLKLMTRVLQSTSDCTRLLTYVLLIPFSAQGFTARRRTLGREMLDCMRDLSQRHGSDKVNVRSLLTVELTAGTGSETSASCSAPQACAARDAAWHRHAHLKGNSDK